MLDFGGQLVSTVITTKMYITMHLDAMSSSLFASYCVIDTTDHKNFGTYFESFVHISLTSTSRRAAVSHDKLAKNWGIHLDHAFATIQHTTKRGVCIIANSALL